MVFQRRKCCAVPAAPFFNRSQQLSTDAAIAVPSTHCDLRNVAVDHFPMHRIRRPFQSRVCESNDLTLEFGYESDIDLIGIRPTLARFAVSRRYRLNWRQPIPFRIETRMLLGAFEEGVRDPFSVCGDSGPDRNRQTVRRCTHERSRPEIRSVSPKLR